MQVKIRWTTLNVTASLKKIALWIVPWKVLLRTQNYSFPFATFMFKSVGYSVSKKMENEIWESVRRTNKINDIVCKLYGLCLQCLFKHDHIEQLKKELLDVKWQNVIDGWNKFFRHYIHGILPLNKRFFVVKKYSLDYTTCSSHYNWFF